MGKWKNEDDIKAELRAMTDELRKVREGLRNVISPPKPNPSRAFLQRQSFPRLAEAPPAAAADRKRAEPTNTPASKSRKKPR